MLPRDGPQKTHFSVKPPNAMRPPRHNSVIDVQHSPQLPHGLLCRPLRPPILLVLRFVTDNSSDFARFRLATEVRPVSFPGYAASLCASDVHLSLKYPRIHYCDFSIPSLPHTICTPDRCCAVVPVSPTTLQATKSEHSSWALISHKGSSTVFPLRRLPTLALISQMRRSEASRRRFQSAERLNSFREGDTSLENA